MKIKVVSIMFFLVFFLTACNSGEKPKDHLAEIYSIALDNIMNYDEALSSDMKFIAIDMSNFDNLGEKDKKEILNYFKDKYKVDVMDATFEELQQKGYYNPDTQALDGVLLRLQKIDYKFYNNVFFEGSKSRSSLGAVGVENTVHYKDGKWQIKESKETWVS